MLLASRQYRYSNIKFLMLITGCVLVIIFSITYHFISLRIYEQQTHAKFMQTINIVLQIAKQLMIRETHSSLQLLANSTFNKLQIFKALHYQSLQAWLMQTFAQFFKQMPEIYAIGVYPNKNTSFFYPANIQSQCLSTNYQPDDFCIEHHQLALRISLPIISIDKKQTGMISVVVLLSSRLFTLIEQDFGIQIKIVAKQELLYETAHVLFFESTPHLRIDISNMTKTILQEKPTRIINRHGLWYNYTIQLGAKQSSILFYLIRNENFIIWQAIEALVINSLLLFITILIFYYFHVNYKYISFTYRAIFDNMIDWVCYKDIDGVYQMINKPMAYGLFNKHPKEIINKKDTHLLHTDIAQQCTVSDQQVIHNHQPLHLQESGITAHGTSVVLDVLKTPLYHESGKFGGVIACARDISEQHRLQQTIETLENSNFSSEWILNKLFSEMPEFIYVKDLQHRFIRVSASIYAFYNMVDIIGKTDYDLHDSERARQFWEDEDLIFSGAKDGITKQENMLNAKGDIHYFLTTKMAFRNKQGGIVGLLGINQDVTQIINDKLLTELLMSMMTQHINDLVTQRQKIESL